MQSDYSDQSVNWILTARSDICGLVVGNLSKWWTVIHWAAEALVIYCMSCYEEPDLMDFTLPIMLETFQQD